MQQIFWIQRNKTAENHWTSQKDCIYMKFHSNHEFLNIFPNSNPRVLFAGINLQTVQEAKYHGCFFWHLCHSHRESTPGLNVWASERHQPGTQDYNNLCELCFTNLLKMIKLPFCVHTNHPGILFSKTTQQKIQEAEYVPKQSIA